MNDIVWYIAWNEAAGTHIVTATPPAGPVLLKEEVFPVGWPAAEAIMAFVGVGERLRNAGAAASGLAYKIVMRG